jgi:hypothetical protein
MPVVADGLDDRGLQSRRVVGGLQFHEPATGGEAGGEGGVSGDAAGERGLADACRTQHQQRGLGWSDQRGHIVVSAEAADGRDDRGGVGWRFDRWRELVQAFEDEVLQIAGKLRLEVIDAFVFPVAAFPRAVGVLEALEELLDQFVLAETFVAVGVAQFDRGDVRAAIDQDVWTR